jgi:ethanolamine utilization protein EutQ (cupin superfamily)
MDLLGGGLQRMVGVGIDEPPCQIVYEDFFPGPEYHWTTWVDQIDFVTEGRAEITYYQPPSLEEKRTIIVEAPCIYLIPRGTPIVWKVLGDEIFRHISVDIPNPLFPTELAKSLKGKE